MITKIRIVFTELDLFQDGDQFDERAYSEEARAQDVSRMIREAFQKRYPKAKIEAEHGQWREELLEYVDDALGLGYARHDVAHGLQQMIDLLNDVFVQWRRSWDPDTRPLDSDVWGDFLRSL